MKITFKYLLFFILISLFQYFVLKNNYVNNEFITNLITFQSIIFGFCITSLAVFATSRYVPSLYKITDKNNSSLTLLNVLIRGYKVSLVTTLGSVGYLFILEFLLSQTKDSKILLSNIWAIPLLGIVVLNFFSMYRMLIQTIDVILQEAKIRSREK